MYRVICHECSYRAVAKQFENAADLMLSHSESLRCFHLEIVCDVPAEEIDALLLIGAPGVQVHEDLKRRRCA